MSIVIVAIAALITILILCAVISIICACAVAGNYDRSMGEK